MGVIHENAPLERRTCVVCEAEFQARSYSQRKTCSDACSATHRRRQTRARVAAYRARMGT